jgi:AraC family transcriptional regulator of adaptative response / DNA-3-methyladenine glycosylase II
MIRDGVVDREGVRGLARRLGYSERHLRRLLLVELGVGPLTLAQSQRATTARALLENTDLSISTLAFAAGFSSIRQCNEVIKSTFAATPSELRNRSYAPSASASTNELTLQLPVRTPFSLAAILEFLGMRAVPGCEEYEGGIYRRVLRLPFGFGIIIINSAQPHGARHVVVQLQLDDLRDVGPAVARTTRLLDLDADPDGIRAVLEAEPLLAASVAAAPGTRVPGHPDPAELAIRGVLGQQISVIGARRLAGRLVERFGTAIPHPTGSLTSAFPTPAALAGADAQDLPMPRARQRALTGLAHALAEASIDLSPGADREVATSRLLALPGIGPWTASYIRMRALGDPDAFLPSDLGVRRAFEAHGLNASPTFVEHHADAWRPWRSYAVMHLWRGLSHSTATNHDA